MALTEDFDGFFADFGVDATFGSETAKVLFDSPESIIAGGEVISADYSITYKAGTFSTMAYASAITVDGTAYTVNAIQAIEDGKLTRASLSKV